MRQANMRNGSLTEERRFDSACDKLSISYILLDTAVI
jgi:hypothetical protein